MPSDPALPFPGSFIDLSNVYVRTPLPGIAMQIGWGEKMMLSRVSIAPGAVIPSHSHPHEQAGVCLEGAFELEIAGARRVVRRGDLYIIPGGVVHAARGLDAPAVALDFFAPVRDDYLPKADER